MQVENLLRGVSIACMEVRESADLAALLRVLLDIGNLLNEGTKRGSAAGFTLARY